MSFEYLPEEILEDIFERVNNKTILSLTLVCQRFHNIIVSRLKLQNRFKLTLSCCDSGSYDYGSCSLPENCLHHQKKIQSIFRNISRIYTSIKLKCWNLQANSSTAEYQYLYRFFQKYGKNIENFEVCHFNTNFHAFVNIMKLLPNIKHIKLDEFTFAHRNFSKEQIIVKHNFPKLETLFINKSECLPREEKFLTNMFGSVDYLLGLTIMGHNMTMKFFSNLIFQQSKLKSLNVQNLANIQDFGSCGKTIKFQVEELAIHMHNSYNLNYMGPFIKFIESQKRIERLIYNCHNMDFRILECEEVLFFLTNLESLEHLEVIGCGQNFVPVGVEQLSIESYPYLKKLTISRFHADILMHLSLPNLEQLHLYDIVNLGSIHLFLKNNQNIENIKIALSQPQHDEMLDIITKCFRKLNVLILDKKFYGEDVIRKTENLLKRKLPELKLEVV